MPVDLYSLFILSPYQIERRIRWKEYCGSTWEPQAAPRFQEVPVGEYAGLGGRALTSAIVAKEVPPLPPAGSGQQAGYRAGSPERTTGAMSGRLSVGCKSPLTGGIKEANAGGQAAQVLARLGYAAIVLEGKPNDELSIRS